MTLIADHFSIVAGLKTPPIKGAFFNKRAETISCPLYDGIVVVRKSAAAD
ncbi:MAG: hypothetical protein J7K40_06725 [candidate division Zixibacteria bacterium]|nr:hypothetical protein [candidate division Zixibacteria bacterium]